jgi:hypothetical protein
MIQVSGSCNLNSLKIDHLEIQKGIITVTCTLFSETGTSFTSKFTFYLSDKTSVEDRVSEAATELINILEKELAEIIFTGGVNKEKEKDIYTILETPKPNETVPQF